MPETTSRPLDALNKSRGKRVIVELKNNRQYIGKLEAFDIHVNVVLNDAEEHVEEIEEKEVEGKKVSVKTGNKVLKRKIGTVFIRGDTITIISPA
jgi:small nuclear ribonucleoprotein (snRNP)-like protein